MTHFGLVWKGVWRKKIRTILTVLSVFVAFLLFALLGAIGRVFSVGAEAADPDRLVVLNSVSLINPLPIRYKNEIAAMPGVVAVTHTSWFDGYYRDPQVRVTTFSTEPRAYFEMYPELEIPEEQLDAWIGNRIGIVVGEPIVSQFGWKVGDRIPLGSGIWTNKQGSQVWEFVLEGIFHTSDPRGNEAFVLLNHEYFEENRAFGEGTVGMYVIRISEDANPAEVADAIDARFANSPQQTDTDTEQAFAVAFAKQFGNIALIVTLILCAVFFTLLLVAGSTMSQSVRERISELVVLKTLGFQDRSILAIILSESVLVMLIGGLLGLGLGWAAVQGFSQSSAAAMLPGLFVSPEMLLGGVLLMIIAGVAAGIFPALKATRLTIVAALARS